MKSQSLTPILSAKETRDILGNVTLQKRLSETIIMAQEAERKRLSLELHDNVNQLLATAKLFIDRLSTTDKENAEFKSKISQYIDMAFTEIRSLSHGLAQPRFKKNTFTACLQKIVDDIRTAGVFTIFCEFDERIELLDYTKKINLFRIFQEQIKNTIRYSRASFIQTRLFYDEDHALHMIIGDNGVGFDADKKEVGSGLYNIYERTELCGGTATLTTSPGNGCKLEITIPNPSNVTVAESDTVPWYQFA
jgi:two-component system sensor histidine kinase UhpB